MRGIQRLPEPQILIDRKKNWLDNFLASTKARPDSSKYAHATILANLVSMSFHKCFYCESQLKGISKEVDHHIEVSLNRELAFEWENLFLSCFNCNKKIPHNVISIGDALNPCIHTDDYIQQHLTFEKEIIDSKGNSELGLLTIKKYRLDTELLDNKRLKQISTFQDLLIVIRETQIKENRSHLTLEEKTAIDRFKRVDQPYSLMFKVLLTKHGL